MYDLSLGGVPDIPRWSLSAKAPDMIEIGGVSDIILSERDRVRGGPSDLINVAIDPSLLLRRCLQGPGLLASHAAILVSVGALPAPSGSVAGATDLLMLWTDLMV